jgi:hypothetical protein
MYVKETKEKLQIIQKSYADIKVRPPSPIQCHMYNRINPTKPPASSAGNVGEPRLTPHKLEHCAK